MYSRNREMPKINLEQLEGMLTSEQFELVKGIVAKQGKNKGCLRAAKPKVTFNEDCFGEVEPDAKEGKTAYVWRMVAFYASPLSQHHCMPCTADWSLPGSYQERYALTKELDKLVEVVLSTIPKENLHGLRRWGQVFGVVGTPQYNDDGAIVYR